MGQKKAWAERIIALAVPRMEPYVASRWLPHTEQRRGRERLVFGPTGAFLVEDSNLVLEVTTDREHAHFVAFTSGLREYDLDGPGIVDYMGIYRIANATHLGKEVYVYWRSTWAARLYPITGFSELAPYMAAIKEDELIPEELETVLDEVRSEVMSPFAEDVTETLAMFLEQSVVLQPTRAFAALNSHGEWDGLLLDPKVIPGQDWDDIQNELEIPEI